jgi:hypothetical protein
MPETPISDNAERTSSSLNGLMIAVTSFMFELPSIVEWEMQLSCHTPRVWKTNIFQR